MSELAYNLSGEPFEVPGAAAAWRVRRLKSKGAPEVVYSLEGIPLMLPIDADMDDLRREARHEGRYRVDALDEHNRPIAGCPAGYVCIHEGEPTVAEPPVAKPLPVVTTADQALVEAMRIQAGLAQSIVDKFATMLEASAVLLRAAENAGLPQRLPRFFLDVGENDDADKAAESDDTKPTEEASAAPKSGLPAIVDSVVAAGTTALVNAIVNGKIKIPGGLGALIDCRRAVPKDSGAAAPATLIPGVVPAPGPRDPAPAVSAVVPHAPMAATPAPPPTPVASASAPPASVAEVPEGLPTIDAATMQHFQDILNALTLHEQMHTQALAAELPPQQLRAWIQELQSLSVGEGAAKIRAFLQAIGGTPEPAMGGTAGALGKGDAS